jgi:hypothetical protein
VVLVVTVAVVITLYFQLLHQPQAAVVGMIRPMVLLVVLAVAVVEPIVEVLDQLVELVQLIKVEQVVTIIHLDEQVVAVVLA